MTHRLTNTKHRPNSAMDCSTNHPRPTCDRDKSTRRTKVAGTKVHVQSLAPSEFRRPNSRRHFLSDRLAVIAATQYPDAIVKDNGLMISPARPWRLLYFLAPMNAVRRRPDIVAQTLLVAKVIVLGTTEDPHATFELDNARCQTRTPAGCLGSFFQSRPLRLDQTSLVAPWPSNRPFVQPPMIHMRSAKSDRHRQIAVAPRRCAGDQVPCASIAGTPYITWRRGKRIEPATQ